MALRSVEPGDVDALCAILNELITAGGTTAFEVHMTSAEFYDHFVRGSNCLTCFIAETVSFEILGFQVLARHPALPSNWADIGTFTRIGSGRSGIGTALFTMTRQAAHELGMMAINATIRADNLSGIHFYDRMGFETYHIGRGVPLRDGTPVDRISKRHVF